MEKERKFVIDIKEFYKFKEENSKQITALEISQYYIPALDGTFRLRRTRHENNSYSFIIALKKFVSNGINEELEVNIDSNVAYEIIAGIKNLKSLRKIRHILPFKGCIWEIDIFQDGLDLGLAEVELFDLEQEIKQPYFIREEVTGNYKFSNEFIANNFSN